MSAALRSWQSILRRPAAEVTFSTVLGDDSYRDFVTDDLKNADIEVHAVIDRSRPTVNKNAIVVGGYRLLKVDTLDNRSISDQILEEITGAIKKVPTDAVVFADFRHGHFQPPHHPRTGAGAARGLFPGRGQPGRKPLGQHHRLSGLRSDHAQ